jgi:O-antigen/teichoic acid export membrane protein
MIKTVSSVLALRVLGIAFQLGWFMLLVRLLPMEQVGVYAAINAGWLLMRALGPVGSDQALMRRLPELLEAEKFAEAKQWQSAALRFCLLRQSAIVLLGLALAIASSAIGLWQPSYTLLALAAVVSLFYGINGQQVYVMLAAARPLLANGWETIWLPAALALSALALNAMGLLSLETLLFAQGGIMAAFCAVGLWLVRCMLRGEQPLESLTLCDKTQRREFAQQSYSLFATSAAIHLTMRLPVMLAPFIIGATGTALLETATRFATLLGLVPFAAAQVSLPKISAHAKAGRLAPLQMLLIKGSWLCFVPTLALYAGLCVLGQWLITLLVGAGYEAAYLPMIILGAAYTFGAAAGPMQHVYTMSGKARFITRISLSEMALSLLLILLLGTWFGAIGMATAVAIGMVFRNGLMHWALPKQLQIQAGVFSRVGLTFILERQWK